MHARQCLDVSRSNGVQELVFLPNQIAQVIVVIVRLKYLHRIIIVYIKGGKKVNKKGILGNREESDLLLFFIFFTHTQINYIRCFYRGFGWIVVRCDECLHLELLAKVSILSALFVRGAL